MWPPCRGRIVNQQESSWAAISFSDSPPPPPPPPPRTPLLLLLPSHPLPSHPPSPLCSPKVFCGPCAHPGHTHTLTLACTFTHVHLSHLLPSLPGYVVCGLHPLSPPGTHPLPLLPTSSPFLAPPPPPGLPTLHRSLHQGSSTRSSVELKEAPRGGNPRRI